MSLQTALFLGFVLTLASASFGPGCLAQSDPYEPELYSQDSSGLRSDPQVPASRSPEAERKAIKEREEWLRYSNWEFRHKSGKEPKSLPEHTQLPLSSDPGKLSVGNADQLLVPNWQYRPAQPESRPDMVFNANLPYYGGGAFNSYFGFRRGFLGGARPAGRLGPSLIQLGPSPASGNYYQPSSRQPGSAGGYYAGGDPWVTPVINTGTKLDYWGGSGNPFKKP